MKTHKIYKIMLMALILFTASLSITSIDAEAKAYKAKTLKVTSGKSKTVTTSKKIKKVAIVSKNKNFTATKTGDKTFKVSGTDKGKTQTVKVTYTNKYTQKFKIKTVAVKIPSYAQKIVDELKPLLADPDKGLQTVLAQWEKKLGGTYEFTVGNSYNNNTVSEMTINEVIKNYTVSQKKALILEVYFTTRMTYGLAGHKRTESYWYNRNSNTFFKLLYQGKFWGLCDEGAAIAYDICQYLGIKAYYVRCVEMDHAWACIWVTDKNGTSYWQGIHTTSYARNLKSSVPQKATITKTQYLKYQYNPLVTTIHKRKVAGTPKPAVATQAPITTTAPVQTPAPTKAPTPAPTQTTTTIIFNTPEPYEPYETDTPVATTEPTKAPVVTQAPTQTPIITPEPTVEPTPIPTETPEPQRIVIPHEEHGYTCPGCNVTPYRHKNNNNPYISNFTKLYGTYTVYAHNHNGIIRYFDADGNEYIDINNDGDIMDELIQLAG